MTHDSVGCHAPVHEFFKEQYEILMGIYIYLCSDFVELVYC